MGSTDIPLNRHGRSQAKSAALCLKEEPITHIVTSPLSRAKETAEIIASTLRKPITILEGLKECCWGIKEGHPIHKSHHELLQNWLAGNQHEGAESAENFTKRVAGAFRQALDLPSPVLIVAHGGTYAVLQNIFKWPFDTDLKNGVPLYHRPPERPDHPWFICSLDENEEGDHDLE